MLDYDIFGDVYTEMSLGETVEAAATCGIARTAVALLPRSWSAAVTAHSLRRN